MTTWYVRPDTSHSGTRNGTSYATAWGGWSEIVWGASGVNAGDTLYLCGAHAYTASIAVGAHGGSSNTTRATIRGDYSGDAGSINFTVAGWMNCSRAWTTIKALAITSTASGQYCIYIGAAAGIVIDGCSLVGGYAAVGLDSSIAYTSMTVSNCLISGQENMGIAQGIGTASIVSSGIKITGNTVHDTGLYGIYLAIESTNAAWDTSSFKDYLVANNTVYNTPGPSIYLRTCNNDKTTPPPIYSSGLVVSGNTVHDCGTVAGDNGNHGGLLLSGFVAPLIANNTVRDCYVTGGGIQTAKNKQPRIIFNRVTGIRSGTDTASFQNGFPIDGNGIFFDDLTIDGLAYGNYIADLISTGDPNSGCGLAFWTATGSKYIGNIVKDCNRGTFFGRSEETGNHVLNNTFINCNAAVWKVGTSALTGNITVKNNIMHNCGIGFFIGANPSTTADYNNIYGSPNPYVGISQGANDLSVHPMLDTLYRPQAAALMRSGANLGGKDYYGRPFYQAPNFGAVEDLTASPRYTMRK
jgi:hypothetical protein